MNARIAAAEVLSLAALAIAVYAGTTLLVAAFGDGEAASFGAAASVVFLSYGLAWTLRRSDLSEQAMRGWGFSLSLLLFCLIMHIEIAGHLYVWQLGWLADLLVDGEAALEGHAGDVIEVALLGVAWILGVNRGSRPLSLERLLVESSIGLIVVLFAGMLATRADAPGALDWLAVPYMAASLASLALLNLRSVEVKSGQSSTAWAWVGGLLVLTAVAAAIVNVFEPPALEAFPGIVAAAATGLAIGAALVLAPFIIVIGFVVELVADLVFPDGSSMPEQPDVPTRPEQPEARSQGEELWSTVVGYATLAVLVIAILTALWFSFQKLLGEPQEELEMREEVERATGAPGPGSRSLLAGALGWLRGRGAAGPQDAIGRLYVSMLRRAEVVGLARPSGATPGEFAPRLQAQFGSEAPVAISDAYARARYGGHPITPAEIDRLQRAWRDVVEMS